MDIHYTKQANQSKVITKFLKFGHNSEAARTTNNCSSLAKEDDSTTILTPCFLVCCLASLFARCCSITMETDVVYFDLSLIFLLFLFNLRTLFFFHLSLIFLCFYALNISDYM